MDLTLKRLYTDELERDVFAIYSESSDTVLGQAKFPMENNGRGIVELEWAANTTLPPHINSQFKRRVLPEF